MRKFLVLAVLVGLASAAWSRAQDSSLTDDQLTINLLKAQVAYQTRAIENLQKQLKQVQDNCVVKP